VDASKPPLKHRVEQRITASDSTESLIRFCKEIDRDTGNSGKINHRNSQNYPANSGNSGFFTDDKLRGEGKTLEKTVAGAHGAAGRRHLTLFSSSRANGRRKAPPDDRLGEAIQ
jgi:hypothetical protein